MEESGGFREDSQNHAIIIIGNECIHTVSQDELLSFWPGTLYENYISILLGSKYICEIILGLIAVVVWIQGFSLNYGRS